MLAVALRARLEVAATPVLAAFPMTQVLVPAINRAHLVFSQRTVSLERKGGPNMSSSAGQRPAVGGLIVKTIGASGSASADGPFFAALPSAPAR